MERARRSWLFVEGANEAAPEDPPQSGADVLIQQLEDFTPPARRAHARSICPDAIEMDGELVEVPTYVDAQRLLARSRELGVE